MATETNVKEEVYHEETVQPQELTNVSQNDSAAQSQPQENASNKEYNFRKLEESKKQLEGKVEQLEEIVRKIASENTESSQSTQSPQDYLGLGDEDLAEGKHLKMVTKELHALKTQMQEKELKAVPDRLTSKFSDFNEVVSKENVEKLKNAEPELYASIISGADLYAKGVSAYKALKGLGIVNDEFQEQKDQVHENHNRPMSAQSIKGHSALSEKNIFAGGLTPDLKKQLQKEMADAAKAR